MYLLCSVLFITLVVLNKILMSKKQSFWKKHGIYEVDIFKSIGILDFLLGRKTQIETDQYAYTEMGYTHKFCGIMEMSRPVLLVKDPDLIKKILIKNFDTFVDRRKFFSGADGCASKMLFSLEGKEWNTVRNIFTPAFTTAKIRGMMGLINEIGKEWVQMFAQTATSNCSGSVNIDVSKSVNQYTVEVVARAVFGMKPDVITNPMCTFIKMAYRVGDFNKLQMIKFAFRVLFPRLSRLLGYSIFDHEALSFFAKILEQGLKSRMSGETKRTDFLQQMAEAKTAELKRTCSDSSESTDKQQYLTESVMTAQCVVFFFAGFSTTGNIISFTLYVLALNPHIQTRLRKEVDAIFTQDDNMEYDDLGKFVYLDMIINEVMRKFPVASRLERVCCQDYCDPDSGLVIPKGTVVAIPVPSLHNDKRYFDNPEEFDPENFSKEKKAARHPCAFLAFGDGKRNCIGMRFSLIQMKSIIANVVHNFIIEPTATTPVPLQTQRALWLVVPPDNLELKLTPTCQNNNYT